MNVERLRQATLSIISGNQTEDLVLNLASNPLNCAIMVNFKHSNLTLDNQADAIELRDFVWWGFDPQGFKLDVFTNINA